VGVVGGCSSDDVCTFGNCGFKETVLGFVAATDINCTHPHVQFVGRIALTASTDARTKVAHRAVARVCSALAATPSRCDTRFSQAWEEWVLVFVSQVLACFRVCQLYFDGVDNDHKKTM